MPLEMLITKRIKPHLPKRLFSSLLFIQDSLVMLGGKERKKIIVD